VQFEWDEAKNRANIDKHGISLSRAERIFASRRLTIRDARFDYGEERYVSIGQAAPGEILAVVYTVRDGRFRIISARPASRAERKRYEKEA